MCSWEHFQYEACLAISTKLRISSTIYMGGDVGPVSFLNKRLRMCVGVFCVMWMGYPEHCSNKITMHACRKSGQFNCLYGQRRVFDHSFLNKRLRMCMTCLRCGWVTGSTV